MSYTINNYRAKRLGNKYFVTTDHGSYCILSEGEFGKLKENDMDKKLKEKLEEREIILRFLVFRNFFAHHCSHIKMQHGLYLLSCQL
jgi:hypothetical protein